MRSESKDNDISICEEFSTSTRLVRKTLIEFGNSQVGSP